MTDNDATSLLVLTIILGALAGFLLLLLPT